MAARIARNPRVVNCENPSMAMNEVVARLDRIDVRLERWEAESSRTNAEQRRERLEARDFMDALLRRHAGVTQDMIAALQALQAEILDQREQIQATTQAILRLLDERFGPERPQG
jgi:cupin superfamily acireductone dioxygenase involved in methionine salvage